MNDRNLALIVGSRIAEEVHDTRIKIAAVADAGQINLRQARIGSQQECVERIFVRSKTVIEEEGLVGDRNSVPAPDPFVVERKLALGVDAAAEFAIAWLAVELPRVVLANSVGPDVVSTVDQALTELSFHQQALLGRITRRDGEIVIGRQREIIGHRHADTVTGAGRVARDQEAALALDRGVRCREERQIGDRLTEELEARVLEIHHLLGLVMDDARALDLP